MIQNLEQHYKVLGLEPGASLEEVNQAYKDLVFIWHPDRVPQENERLIQKSVAKLQQINEARDSLRSYHRKYPKAAAKSKSQSSTYPPRQDYYRDRSQSASNANRAKNTDSYQSYSQRNRSNSNSSYQSDRSTNNGYRYSDRQTYSQTYSQQTKRDRQRDPWDYRAYYYAPKNAGSDRQSSRDGYRDFRQTDSPQSERAEKNYKRPYQKDLRGADLSRSNFKEKDFSGRDLSEADLSYSDLSDTFLHKITLENANLQGANLKGANLLQANLRGANLQEANLIGADLSGSDLSGANLAGAKVGFSNKLMVKITAVKLTGATLPDGSIHP